MRLIGNGFLSVNSVNFLCFQILKSCLVINKSLQAKNLMVTYGFAVYDWLGYCNIVCGVAFGTER